MNWRRFDRVLTAVALFFSGVALTGLAYAVLKEFALEVGTWGARPPGPVIMVQGRYVELPRRDARVRIPVVLQDGTLDPRREYRWLGWGADLPREQNPPAAFVDWRGAIRRVEIQGGTRDDYRWQAFQGFTTRTGWVVSPGRGILAVDPRGKFLGSLTDEGFVYGGRAPSSFNRTLQWYPNTTYPFSMWEDPLRGGAEEDAGVLYYVTAEGLYRADLNARAIVRLLPLDASPALLWASPLHRRLYVVARDRIHWRSLEDPARGGAFDVPASVRGEALEVAEGSRGRILLRSRVAERYRVDVVDPAGAIESEYAYEFAVEGGEVRRGYPWPRPEPALDQVAATVAPVAWRLLLRLPPRLLEVFHFRPERNEFGFGPLWVSGAVSLLLAALVGMRARPHYRTWAGPIAWGAFVFAFGLPAWAVFLFSGARQRADLCRKCGHFRSVAFAACPRCGDPAPSPPALGIEILRPA